MSKNKYQIKHLRAKYTQFHIDFKNEELLAFKNKCEQNGTTTTTEIKRFVREYMNK